MDLSMGLQQANPFGCYELWRGYQQRMWVCLLLLENHHPWVKNEGLASEKAAHRTV